MQFLLVQSLCMSLCLGRYYWSGNSPSLLQYIVELLPFNNDSILKAPTSGSSEILLSHSVAIATQRSVGLAPIPSTTRPNLRGESNRPRPRTTTTIRANHQTVPYFVSYYLTVPAV